MPKTAQKIKAALLDLLFPIECFGCRAPDTYLCARCFEKIPVEDRFACPLCLAPSFENRVCDRCKRSPRATSRGERCKRSSRPVPPFEALTGPQAPEGSRAEGAASRGYHQAALDGVIAASAYDTALVRRLIFAFKYRFVRDLATSLALLIMKRLASHDFSFLRLENLVLVPVPLSPARERWRGFNQALEISRALGTALDIPVAERALARARSTTPQVEIGRRTERFKNIRGAFAAVNAITVRGQVVLLVDDVATTLATLGECARVLKESGAREVWGLVVAREYLKNR